MLAEAERAGMQPPDLALPQMHLQPVATAGTAGIRQVSMPFGTIVPFVMIPTCR